ncbi:MAG: hypothetical protein ACSLE8_07860 [Rhodococcus sp. (in: high G+C Gram-positive bacteria)]
MQRTVTEAKQVLEQNAAAYNPVVFGQLQSEVDAAEKHVRSLADGYVNEMYNRYVTVGTQTGEQLCSIRDDARRLTADLRAGRITAAEGTKRWNELRGAARRLAAANAKAADDAAHIAEVEDDLVGFYDRTIHTKYPSLRPNFTF